MKTLPLLISIFLSFTLSSQEIATKKDGTKVTLNKDGTWTELSEPAKETPNKDCDKLISVTTDKMTDVTMRAIKVPMIISKGGKKGISIDILTGSKETLILSMKAIGSGNCINDDNNVLILFRDGSKLKMENDSKFNCKAKFVLYFRGVFGKTDELKELSSKPIETMRIWTTDGYVEQDFTEKQSQKLIDVLNCI